MVMQVVYVDGAVNMETIKIHKSAIHSAMFVCQS